VPLADLDQQKGLIRRLDYVIDITEPGFNTSA
jgi:hypothetical protein